MLKVEVDPNLARALDALASAESGTQDAMRQAADEAITATWQPALIAAASTSPERKMIATGATADVTPAGFVLTAGNGALSGGLGENGGDWAAIEYGMTPVQITTTKRRKKIRIAGSGREMTVATSIWVGKNLRPRNSEGYVAMPTVRQHAPEFVAAWVYGLIGQFDSVDGTALEIAGR